MKSNYKKTFFGSILAFFVGTSCCWMSALAIWVGGLTFFGTAISFIESIQGLLIFIGIFLGIVTVLLYLKKH